MKIGFIGVGNMGSAIMRAVLTCVSSDSVYIADADSDKASRLSKNDGTNASTSLEIAEVCDCIFLGVKPQMMRELLKTLSPVLNNRQDKFFLVSMAAGLEISTLSEMLGKDFPIIRIMPNLPVSVGEGMTMYDSQGVTNEQISAFEDIMKNTGKLIRLREDLIDAGCAVSGCGPAFVCMMIEAMADGGVKCGLPRSTAQALAIQTLLGTSKLLCETETHPAVLKDAVCSPGGSTIAGVNALEQSSFRAAAINAVEASFNRNRELGKK